MTGKRKRYSAEFKAKVAVEAIRGEQTIAQLAAKHGVHQTMINAWKVRRTAIEGMSGMFSGKAEAAEAARECEIDQLHAKIGQLVVERDFCDEPPVDECRAEVGDDRAQPPDAGDHAPVSLDRHQPFSLLRRPTDRERGELGADAGYRRAVHGDAVVWLAKDGAASSPSRPCGRPQARAPADGAYGPCGGLSAAEDDCASSPASGVALAAARSGHRSS
jgi:transposase